MSGRHRKTSCPICTYFLLVRNGLTFCKMKVSRRTPRTGTDGMCTRSRHEGLGTRHHLRIAYYSSPEQTPSALYFSGESRVPPLRQILSRIPRWHDFFLGLSRHWGTRSSSIPLKRDLYSQRPSQTWCGQGGCVRDTPSSSYLPETRVCRHLRSHRRSPTPPDLVERKKVGPPVSIRKLSYPRVPVLDVSVPGPGFYGDGGIPRLLGGPYPVQRPLVINDREIHCGLLGFLGFPKERR